MDGGPVVSIAGAGRVSQRRPGHARARLVAIPVVLSLVIVAGLAVRRATDAGDAPHELLVGVSDLTFSSTDLRVEEGEVSLALANTDAVPHTFTIAALGVDVQVGGGEAARATFTATPGRYAFVCTIPGHDSPGMRGVLTVTR